MDRSRGIRFGLGALAAVLVFGAFAVTSWAGDPQFNPATASLAPDPVTGGTDVLYTVTYPHVGHETLTHPEIAVRFPADWTYSGSAEPATCTQTGPTTLNCTRESIGSHAPPVIQAVKFTTGAVLADATREVNSRLSFKDDDADEYHSHLETVAAPAAKVTVAPVRPNAVAKCAAPGGETVSTQLGASASNALTTTMIVPPTDALCSPVAAKELPPNDTSVHACPPGVKCTTEIAVTSAPEFTPAHPITLIFDIFGRPKNWYKNGRLPAVAKCTGHAGTAAPDPCISKRKKMGKRLRLTVLWTGNDPSWQG